MLLIVSPDLTLYRRWAAVGLGFGVAPGVADGGSVDSALGSGVGLPWDEGVAAGGVVGDADATPATAPPGTCEGSAPPAGDWVRAITRTMKARTISPTRRAWPPLRADAVGSAPMRRAGSRTTGAVPDADHSEAPSSPGPAGLASAATARAARNVAHVACTGWRHS